MKSTILTFLLLGILAGTAFGQLLIYPKDRTVFKLNGETGEVTSIIPTTTTSIGAIEFDVYKEFISVTRSDYKTTKFIVKHLSHEANSKLWILNVSREGIVYEVHLDLKDNYIMFISKDPKFTDVTLRDRYNLEDKVMGSI